MMEARSKTKKDMLRVNEASQQQSLEVNLYALKDRINQLYFSILLMKEQKRQNEIKQSNFRNALLIRLWLLIKTVRL
jgi:hypothetical protein